MVTKIAPICEKSTPWDCAKFGINRIDEPAAGGKHEAEEPPLSWKHCWVLTLSPGKAVKGRGGFDGGQETMNSEAMVKTELGSRGCRVC